MKYAIGQIVEFTRLGQGKYQKAQILERKIDNPKRFIDTPNAKGNFDYLIEIQNNGRSEQVFCQEFELK
jgi:hypothetical protein